MATETTSNDDETSDYYSLSGYGSITSRSHSRSQSLCTEFLSCLEEEEEGHTPLVPFPPTSLEEELEELEMEDQLEQLELRRGLSEGAGPPSSSHRCVKLQEYFLCCFIDSKECFRAAVRALLFGA